MKILDEVDKLLKNDWKKCQNKFSLYCTRAYSSSLILPMPVIVRFILRFITIEEFKYDLLKLNFQFKDNKDFYSKKLVDNPDDTENIIKENEKKFIIIVE